MLLDATMVDRMQAQGQLNCARVQASVPLRGGCCAQQRLCWAMRRRRALWWRRRPTRTSGGRWSATRGTPPCKRWRRCARADHLCQVNGCSVNTTTFGSGHASLDARMLVCPALGSSLPSTRRGFRVPSMGWQHNIGPQLNNLVGPTLPAMSLPHCARATRLVCPVCQAVLAPVDSPEGAREALLRLEDELRRLDRAQGGGHTAAADMVAFYAATSLWFAAERNYKARGHACQDLPFPGMDGVLTHSAPGCPKLCPSAYVRPSATAPLCPLAIGAVMSD